MRAHLDRNLQDPARRRERLATIVQGLVKPRGASELARWLVRELRAAVGARACTLLMEETDWKPWHGSGTVRSLPTTSAREQLRAGSGSDPEPVALGADLLLAVSGTSGTIGALWIEAGHALDPGSTTLLRALAGALGVMLEHGLGVESLIRDPKTGLLAEGAFLERASDVLATAPPGGMVTAVIGLRVAGIETIREARGARAAEAAMLALARAAEEAVPTVQALGVRFDNVLAIRAELAAGDAELDIAAVARAVEAVLRARAEAGPPLAVATAYLAVDRALAEAHGPLERLTRELGQAPAGSIVRVE